MSRARVKGVEIETTIAPVRGLTLTANATYLDGRIREGTLAALPSDVGTIILGQNQTVVSQNVAGNHLTRSPKWQAYASLAYAIDTGFGTVTPSLTWRGQTKTYSSKPTRTTTSTPPPAGARWTRAWSWPARKRWDVSLYARNLFDKRYISQIVPFTGSPSPRSTRRA
jgi:iron complex outermembrane receptor protein